ncbi:unnamed protein product, partial [marine sediment metagenome]
FDEAGSMEKEEVRRLKENGEKSGVIIEILGRKTM